MITKIFKRFFKPKTESITTHSAQIGGHSFTVLDPIKMPKIRQSAFFLGEYERDWGMTKEDILAYDDLLAKLTDFPTSYISQADLVAQLTNNMKKLYNLIDTRRLVIQEDFQYKPFLKAACHIILLDDEDPTKIDPDIYQQKLKLCESNEDILIFFLRIIRAFQQSTLPTFDISKMWTFYPEKHLLLTEKKVYKQINTTIFSSGR